MFRVACSKTVIPATNSACEANRSRSASSSTGGRSLRNVSAIRKTSGAETSTRSQQQSEHPARHTNAAPVSSALARFS